jgi:hypothetical protein
MYSLPGGNYHETEKLATDNLKVPKRFVWRRLLRISLLVIVCLIVAIASITVYLYAHKGAIIKSYEIHNPAVESEQSILAAAHKYQLDTVAIVTPVASEFKYFMGIGVPEAVIFDRNGNNIYCTPSGSCNAGVFGFIRALNSDGHYKIKERGSLPAFMNKLRDLHGNPLPVDFVDKSVDYQVFILWSAWAGLLNKDHVKAWEDIIIHNKKAGIQLIKIDVDLQAWWTAPARDSLLKVYSHIIHV